ncbi:MAG: hypothetical protein ACJ74O_13370 [Frankiaceae bacterium]
MPTTKILTGLAALAWIIAVVLVLGDGADNHFGEAGRAGYLIGMMAITLTLTAWLQRRLRAAVVAFEYGRRTCAAIDLPADDRH